jgi:hypothetical protein
MRSSQSDTTSIHLKASMDNRVGSYIPSDSEDISAACFVPLQKSLFENATIAKR